VKNNKKEIGNSFVLINVSVEKTSNYKRETSTPSVSEYFASKNEEKMS
jgi:hypothetical protein